VAEELALEESFGHRRAVDGDEGPRLAATPAMQRPRDHLFTGAALTGHEDGDVGIRDTIDELEDGLHRRGVTGELVEARCSLDLPPQPLDLLTELTMSSRAIDGDREGLELHRFADEVVRSGADRRDRGVEATEGGEDDDRHVGAIGDDALAELDAVHMAHVEVGHHDIEVLAHDETLRVLCRRSRRDLVAALAQSDLERLGETDIVVDEEDARAHVDSRGKKTGMVP
jgi:hypothetical protein